ncbi:hypothetical protein ACW7GZ_08750 [Luteimonas sp. A537]
MNRLMTCRLLMALAMTASLPAVAQSNAELNDENARLKAQVAELQAQQQSEASTQENRPARRSGLAGLGDRLKKATGISLTRPNANDANDAGGGTAIYTPIGAANTFEGVFSHGNRDLAIQGRLSWPRVALTFVEYGETLPCWTIDARIWTSATQSTTERFQTCLNARLTKLDDLGRTSSFDKRDALTRAKLRRFESAQPLFGYVETTGTKRTAGPNPPRKLFMVDVDRDMGEKVFDAAINAMWVSGFITLEDTGMTSSFLDWRMWIAGFDSDGHRGR